MNLPFLSLGWVRVLWVLLLISIQIPFTIQTFNQNKYYDAKLLIDVFRIFRMSAYFKVKGWFKFLPLHFITSNNTPTFDAFWCSIKSNERAPNEINQVMFWIWLLILVPTFGGFVTKNVSGRFKSRGMYSNIWFPSTFDP